MSACFCSIQFFGADVALQHVICDIHFFLEVFCAVNETKHVVLLTIINLAKISRTTNKRKMVYLGSVRRGGGN
jgi:hypothetical protein